MCKNNTKTFDYRVKENQRICLHYILTRTIYLLENLNDYNGETEILLERYKNSNIPYKTYEEMVDKTGNVVNYLTNLIGDETKTAISYNQYHKTVKKEKNYPSKFGDSVMVELNQLRNTRNWLCHVPKSLLTSELELINEQNLQINFEEIVCTKYVDAEYECLANLYEANIEFYSLIKKIVNVIQKEYTLLIQKSVRYSSVQSQIFKTENFKSTYKSGQKQGLW